MEQRWMEFLRSATLSQLTDFMFYMIVERKYRIWAVPLGHIDFSDVICKFEGDTSER